MATTSGQTAIRTIQSLDRAIAIINALSNESAGRSLCDLAQQLKLQPQTLQSLLRTLQHHGWVVQDSRGRPYRLGPAIGLISRRWIGRQDRAALAAPLVAELSDRIREYVILAEWTGGQLTPMAESQPDRELIVRGESYAANRLHTMATGKLLLAHMDDQRRKQIVADLPMAPLGPRSTTDRATLHKHLRQIRSQGFALCLEEAARGVAAMAVPVASASPPPGVAALGISLPLVRYSAARQKELLDLLRKAALSIEEIWQTGSERPQ